MHKGFISLWRRFANSDLWLGEQFTRGQAWVDLLMLANHKDGFMRKRGIKIIIPRAHVGYSTLALSDRWKWSRGKVIRFLDELEAVQQIRRKTVQQNSKLTTLIEIINYDEYQGRDTTNGTTERTTNGQQTDINNNDNNDNNVLSLKNPEKNPPENPPQERPEFDIEKSITRYTDRQLVRKTIAAIASTRKNGKVADSIIEAQFSKWERYPVAQVEAAMKKYIDKDHAGEGKAEAYLLGIIRNQKTSGKNHGGNHAGFSEKTYTGTPADQISWLKKDEDGDVPEARAV